MNDLGEYTCLAEAFHTLGENQHHDPIFFPPRDVLGKHCVLLDACGTDASAWVLTSVSTWAERWIRSSSSSRAATCRGSRSIAKKTLMGWT